ncbi:hypothetical protein [Fibrella forsythiae]|uniref:Uncharacterized protein n=1 Tax=Fibrella forsythiae TaxID=2817061 RepID=A0ABS3JCB1_9BACT|nr:hypothetical protein [Fibrella forsythiae]MBO0947631.1 hypothetical protein [Fibrella forsythiae]
MSRPSRFFSDHSSMRLTAMFALNALCIVAVIGLRYMLPTTFQRPTLSIPNVGDFSIANWFANRLADVVALIQDLLRHLIQ